MHLANTQLTIKNTFSVEFPTYTCVVGSNNKSFYYLVPTIMQ